MHELKCTTYSANGIWSDPLIEIITDTFRYSQADEVFHGIQVDKTLIDKEKDILAICDEISNRMRLLFTLINP